MEPNSLQKVIYSLEHNLYPRCMRLSGYSCDPHYATREDLKRICRALLKNKTVQSFWFDPTILTTKNANIQTADFFLEFLRKTTTLTHLTLYMYTPPFQEQTILVDQVFVKILNSISKHPSIRGLQLSLPHLSACMRDALAELLKNGNLTSIMLIFTSEYYAELGKVSLQSIDLRNNTVIDTKKNSFIDSRYTTFLDQIMKGVIESKHLEELYLCTRPLTDPEMFSFCKGIAGNNSLKKITVDFNHVVYTNPAQKSILNLPVLQAGTGMSVEAIKLLSQTVRAKKNIKELIIKDSGYKDFDGEYDIVDTKDSDAKDSDVKVHSEAKESKINDSDVDMTASASAVNDVNPVNVPTVNAVNVPTVNVPTVNVSTVHMTTNASNASLTKDTVDMDLTDLESNDNTGTNSNQQIRMSIGSSFR